MVDLDNTLGGRVMESILLAVAEPDASKSLPFMDSSAADRLCIAST